MNFGRVISELLINNQKVSIPGFGKLTYSYVSAELYKFTNRVAPPAHKLEFSPIPDEDNFFAETLANEYDTSLDEAYSQIAIWVSEIFSILNNGGQYQLEQVGRFKKDSEKIVFTPDEKSILFADTFGLESAKIPLMEIEETKKPVSTSTPTPIPIQEKKNVKSNGVSPMLKRIAIIAAIVVLVVIGGYFLYETGILKSTYKAVSGWFKPSKTDQEPVVLSDSADALKRNALNYSESDEDSTSSSQRYIVYYIVAGSFKSMKNAEKEVENLKKKGFNPDVLNMSDTLFRVTIGTYNDRRKAVEEYIALTNQDTGLNIWLFSQLNRQ